MSRTFAPRPNRYAAPCIRCGNRVEAEAGLLAKNDRGRWAAEHRGECPEAPAPQAAAPSAERRGGDWTQVPDGRYAVPSQSGRNDLDFWFVSTAPDDAGEWAGFRRVSRVVGGRADGRVRGATRTAALEAIIAAGIEDARMTYARELGRCWHCNLHLTDEASRAAGMGPVCRRGGRTAPAAPAPFEVVAELVVTVAAPADPWDDVDLPADFEMPGRNPAPAPWDEECGDYGYEVYCNGILDAVFGPDPDPRGALPRMSLMGR